MKSIKNVSIAGAGTMGASMAQTFAKYGYSVVLYDLYPEALEKAKRLMSINLETEVSEGLLTDTQAERLLARIHFTHNIGDFENTDFMVEAILEKLDIKHQFWAEVSQILPEDAILASNTSGLSITKIAQSVKHPQRFAGMHWINPPHIIPLVEVIKGELTEQEAADAVYQMALNVGKKPVMVNDAPGFVLNRIQFAVLRECLHIYEEGIASTQAIDDVMKYALGFRYACLGPFEVADLGGLDIFHNIASYLFADLCNEKDSFSLLKECFDNKRFGVKSGCGFYDYSDGKDKQAIMYRDQMFTKLAKCLFNEAQE